MLTTTTNIFAVKAVSFRDRDLSDPARKCYTRTISIVTEDGNRIEFSLFVDNLEKLQWKEA